MKILCELLSFELEIDLFVFMLLFGAMVRLLCFLSGEWVFCYVKGKSSQVPQFLLEENMEPILCTQPRRFAVVAIARMVAKARNCDVGGEIGYHIGHSNVSDINSTRYLVLTINNF